jgi:hypothetical protein
MTARRMLLMRVEYPLRIAVATRIRPDQDAPPPGLLRSRLNLVFRVPEQVAWTVL